jgi:hypothetical protein
MRIGEAAREPNKKLLNLPYDHRFNRRNRSRKKAPETCARVKPIALMAA